MLRVRVVPILVPALLVLPPDNWFKRTGHTQPWWTCSLYGFVSNLGEMDRTVECVWLLDLSPIIDHCLALSVSLSDSLFHVSETCFLWLWLLKMPTQFLFLILVSYLLMLTLRKVLTTGRWQLTAWQKLFTVCDCLVKALCYLVHGLLRQLIWQKHSTLGPVMPFAMFKSV